MNSRPNYYCYTLYLFAMYTLVILLSIRSKALDQAHFSLKSKASALDTNPACPIKVLIN